MVLLFFVITENLYVSPLGMYPPNDLVSLEMIELLGS